MAPHPVLSARPRLLLVAIVVLLLSGVAVLLRDAPAAQRALDVARDPERFSSSAKAVEALTDIGDAAKDAFEECGSAPACDGWAQAAGVARVARAVSAQCTATGREQVRRLVLSYLEAVHATPSEQTPPDPRETPSC